MANIFAIADTEPEPVCYVIDILQFATDFMASTERTRVHMSAPLKNQPLLMAVAVMVVLGALSNLHAQPVEWSDIESVDSTFSARDSAIDALHKRIATDSSDRDAWFDLIGRMKDAGRFGDELQYALLMRRNCPDSAHTLFVLADAQLDNGYVYEAIDVLGQALALHPQYVRALTMMAESYDLISVADTALIFLDSAIACNPRFVQAHFQRAELLNKIGRPIDAIESYRTWANLQPFVAEPWIKLGSMLCHVNRYDEAVETLNYALELKPDSPKALFQLAMAKQGLGLHTEAREAFKDIFFRFPSDEIAQKAEARARALGWKPGEN
jgi:tetratricopeptide (TPR) repeat protein